MSIRTDRVASTIQRELAQIIMRELGDPRLAGSMPAITRVKVAGDLSVADVYVTIMGTPGQQTAALNALKHSAGLMRTRLTEAMHIRVAPFLRFQIDENLKKELAVQELLQKIAEENADIDRRRAAEAGANAAGANAAGANAAGANVGDSNNPDAAAPSTPAGPSGQAANPQAKSHQPPDHQ